MERKDGLSSMSMRLSKLEKNQQTKHNSSDEDNDILSDFVSSLKKKEKKHKKERFASILHHFVLDVQADLKIIDKANTIELIIFTIRYIEANHKKISDYLGVPSNSEFKRGLCISFLKYFEFIDFDEDFYEMSINSLCRLLFPIVIPEPVKEAPKEEVVKKKKKGVFF